MSLHPIEFQTFTPEVLDVFASRNALLTVGDRRECNTMTIGWCGLGRMWQLPACTVYVRPERYTYSFLERFDSFTVSVFSPEWKKQIAYCGSKSGRDVDKVKECGFTVDLGAGDAPYFREADWVLVCRKRYAQDLKPECCLDPRIAQWYVGMGWHRMYIGEIVEAYAR